MEQDIEQRIKEKDKISKRHLADWSGKKWISGVVANYKEMQKEFEKASIFLNEKTGRESSLLKEGLGIELIGLMEEEEFRIYSLLTPWVLDMIMEFKIDLDDVQIKRLKEAGASMVSPLTNEKSRWVMAGTSLVNQHPRDALIRMGKNWAENTYFFANRIIFKLHDIKGNS